MWWWMSPITPRLLAEMAEQWRDTYAFRQNLALTAYARTAAYDAAVSGWMAVR